jgi:hypothetical protein
MVCAHIYLFFFDFKKKINICVHTLADSGTLIPEQSFWNSQSESAIHFPPIPYHALMSDTEDSGCSYPPFLFEGGIRSLPHPSSASPPHSPPDSEPHQFCFVFPSIDTTLHQPSLSETELVPGTETDVAESRVHVAVVDNYSEQPQERTVTYDYPEGQYTLTYKLVFTPAEPPPRKWTKKVCKCKRKGRKPYTRSASLNNDICTCTE